MSMPVSAETREQYGSLELSKLIFVLYKTLFQKKKKTLFQRVVYGFIAFRNIFHTGNFNYSSIPITKILVAGTSGHSMPSSVPISLV